jgi:hypothetical protein
LHNISPTEICLYPEPKKRGRPSASTSVHHNSQHHNSFNSSSVVKKKLNLTNKGRVPSSPSPLHTVTRSPSSSTNTSPTTNVINLQPQQRWQKTSFVNPSEPIVCLNRNETLQFVQPLPINLAQIQPAITDLYNINLINNYNDFLYTNQPQYSPQLQSRGYTLNAKTYPGNLISSQSAFATSPNTISTNMNGTANSYYRSYTFNGNSNNGTRSYTNSYNSSTSQNSNIPSSGSTSNLNHNNSCNNDTSDSQSHHYLLNIPYHHSYSTHAATNMTLAKMNNNDRIYTNLNNNYISNFNNEGNISDSSDSPYSSLTSTPELLPTLNPNTPSVSNSPLLPPSDFSNMYGNGNMNIIYVDPLTHDYLPSYHESELNSSLLSDSTSEIAYISPIAPFLLNQLYLPFVLRTRYNLNFYKN